MLNGPQREAVKLTPEEAKIVERLRQYRMDTPRDMADCLRIVDKKAKLTPLILNEAQLILHAKAEAQRREIGMVRAMVLKGRKQGCSTYIGGRFYSKARLFKHRNVKVMAHDQKTTHGLFQMVKTFHGNDPLALQAQNDSATELRFSNKSSYSVLTAGGSGEGGRGDTPFMGHMSEVAFYKNAQKNYASFANSIPIERDTEVWAESTANGLGNEFHKRWSLAEGGLASEEEMFAFLPIFIPWFISSEYALPVENFVLRGEPEGDGLPSERDIADMYGLSPQQMAWRRFMINSQFGGSVETFMQEYPCTPQEAFQTPGLDLFIKPLAIARARRRTGIKPYGPKILGVDPAGLGGDKFMMTLRQGMVMLWHRGRPGVEPGEEQVEWVASIMMEEGVDRCNIDYSGGWGSALLAGLRERYPDLAEKCHPVDFGAKSQAKMVKPHVPGPRNRRAEMYVRMREWFNDPEGCSIPDEDSLQSDLGAVTARISGQSTDTVLCSKQEIKKALHRSPDTSDSAALTFAVPDRTIQTSLTPTKPGATAQFNAGRVDQIEKDPFDDPFSRPMRTGFDSGGGWM